MPSGPSEIRMARLCEEEPILRMVRAWRMEEYQAPLDESKARLMVRRLLLRIGGAVLVVAGSREIEGTMGMIMASPWCDSDIHLETLWHFIAPAYRKSDAAKRLLIEAKKYSDGLGIPVAYEARETPQTAPKAALVGRQIPREGSLFIHRPRAA